MVEKKRTPYPKTMTKGALKGQRFETHVDYMNALNKLKDEGKYVEHKAPQRQRNYSGLAPVKFNVLFAHGLQTNLVVRSNGKWQELIDRDDLPPMKMP